MRKLALTLLKGKRSQDGEPGGEVDAGAAEEDAVKLYEAGEAKWGTSEDVFIEILANASPSQVSLMPGWSPLRHLVRRRRYWSAIV